ncbi:MAG: hypothetical protein B7Y39_02240 [Bdellovibrio sp. 28-41-41]|nr:MAG: hypothetical protein B7Y39_02240 [Bdellovibrio sp. 28-41-41]
MSNGILALVVFHFVLWLVTSVVLVLDKYTDRKKAVLQGTFALFVPIVGSLLVLVVNTGFRMKAKKPPEREMGQSIDEHMSKYYGANQLSQLFSNN